MSERKISRQRSWQLRQLAKGCCIKCGAKADSPDKQLCTFHREQRLSYRRHLDPRRRSA